MNYFETLSSRIENFSWDKRTENYALSRSDLDGIFRWLRYMSAFADGERKDNPPHFMGSPARFLGYHRSKNSDQIIEDLVNRARGQGLVAMGIFHNALEWADFISGTGAIGDAPVDLFEPMLSLLERGCTFRLNKGYLEIGDGAIPLHRWPYFADPNRPREN